jgi:2-polyprenyl-3-methyl-5-hydroxy-6-metoxy-1,4-benzoquinol methylase
LNLETRVRLLDVACGSGQLAILAARRGLRVTGVDIATNSIAAARNRAASEGLDGATRPRTEHSAVIAIAGPST